MPITNEEHIQLWNRIENYSFDKFSDSSKNFTTKLCWEEKWTTAKARKLIQEYKRFVFLCCVLEDGASPSHDVDKVWHLHLTYTKEYWQVFCKDILQKDLHHYPSNGVKEDDNKLKNKYLNTLEAYFSFFDDLPEIEIWSDVDLKKKIKQMDKVPISYQFAIWGCVLFLPLLFSEEFAFLLNGPQFLGYYFMLMCAAIFVTFLHMSKKRQEFEHLLFHFFTKRPSIYQIAFHFFDKHHAIQTALLNLMENQLLVVVQNEKIMETTDKSARNEDVDFADNPFRAFPSTYPPETEIKYTEVENLFKRTDFQNVQLHFLLDAIKGNLFNRFFFLIIFIGAARVSQGLYNEQPVSFLLMLMFLFFVTYNILGAIYLNERNSISEVLKKKYGYQGLTKIDLSQKFAFDGRKVLAGLSSGAIIATVFPFFDSKGRLTSNSCTSSGGCSSGSSCSGSSCSSGCGGCGGGD